MVGPSDNSKLANKLDGPIEKVATSLRTRSDQSGLYVCVFHGED